MATFYLGDRQRTVEMLAALYAAWYSCFTGIQINWFGIYPISWSRMTEKEQGFFAWFLLIAALIHGIGIKINGRWHWSPVLRVVALGMHLTAMSFLLMKTGFGSSVTANYSFIVGLLAFGLGNAIDDTVKAWRSHGRSSHRPFWQAH